MFDQNIFCERLKSLRSQKNLTLKDFGSLFGVANQSVSKWETGVNLPSIHTLVDIAESFNISVDYLLGLSDNPKRNE